jgi:hypothetical protein
MSGMDGYEQLVMNEDVLVWRLQTLERVLRAIFCASRSECSMQLDQRRLPIRVRQF